MAASADTYYYLLQELYTVTGLIEKNGALAEANVYDGYGKVTIWDYSPGDFDRDGYVDTVDQGTMAVALINGGANKSTPDPSTDFDGDGDTDSADLTAFNVYKNAGGAVTEAFVSSIGNPFFFTGRRLYFLETLPEISATAIANQQIQHNRARHYSPTEGRWLQREPRTIGDDISSKYYFRRGPFATFSYDTPMRDDSLYVYSRPTVATDPSGNIPIPILPIPIFPHAKVDSSCKCIYGCPNLNLYDIGWAVSNGVATVCDHVGRIINAIDRDPRNEDDLSNYLMKSVSCRSLLQNEPDIHPDPMTGSPEHMGTLHRVIDILRKLQDSACKNTREFNCHICDKNEVAMQTPPTYHGLGGFAGQPITLCAENIQKKCSLGDYRKCDNMFHELLRWWVDDDPNGGLNNINDWDNCMGCGGGRASKWNPIY